MSESGRLPTSSDAQNIGARADKCFGALCPESWRPESLGGTGDFGIDYLVQVFENNQASDTFKVQLKGTTVPKLNAQGTHFSIQLKASTIRYYARFTESILLVLCDLSANVVAIKCPLYYVWIHDELRRINIRDLPDDQLFVNLRVPKSNSLNGETDLSTDLAQFRALTSIGPSLNMALETRAPTLDPEARAALLGKLPRGFSIRGIALIESLAEEAATVWPDRPPGSMAWLLFEAERHLNRGGIVEAHHALSAAAEQLNAAVPLEIAEYWHISGRMHLLEMYQEEACAAFENAVAAQPNHPKYVSSWAETRMGIDFSEDGPNDFSAIYAALTSSAPAVLSIKARALAAERKYDEAFALLKTFFGPEHLSAKAIVHTVRSESVEAIEICDAGLALPGLKDAMKLLFVILKARAQFNLAVGITADTANEGIMLPFAGTPDMDLELLAMSWDGSMTALQGLRAAGWPMNVDSISDLVCAMASIFGKEAEALAMLVDAAEKRPTLPVLQASVESLAAQTGDFALAIRANSRQHQTSTTRLRKVTILHMAKNDAECVAFFEENLPSFDRSEPTFGEALALAITSAHKLVRGDLTRDWLAIMDGHTELATRRSILNYFIKVSENQSNREEALEALLADFEHFSKPFAIAVHLFFALNPMDTREAERLIEAAEVLMADRLIPLDAVLQLGQALGTLERWPELINLVKSAQRRNSGDKMLRAVEALSLDRLGRTAEARTLLSALISEGVTEPFILYTHIDIATRCGFLDEAIRAVEMLVSTAAESEQKLHHLRVLHSLIRAKDPTDSRARDIAWRIGDLTDPLDEMREGAFLSMLMTSKARGADDASKVDKFQRRLKTYNANFPRSPILRAATIPDKATPEELLSILKKLVGDTPEKIEARRAREDLVLEKKHIPFAWRPRTFVSDARDLPQLWQMAKEAKGREPKLTLKMAFGEWSAHSWEQIRNQVPLMDFVALLITHDLGLLELLFQLFPKIAIPQEVLRELGSMTAPMTDSFAREKCIAIQNTLQKNFEKILQPRVGESEFTAGNVDMRDSEELKFLSRQPSFLLYSDDALFRIFCAENDPSFMGICTLDILYAMESQLLLNETEAAEKVGQLCIWGVGVAILPSWQLASLPSSLNQVGNIFEGVETIRSSPTCIAMFNGMWDHPQLNYQDMQAHAGHLLSTMLADVSRTTTSIASLMAIWCEKTKGLAGIPPDDLTKLASLARQTIFCQDKVTDVFSARLWEVYLLLASHVHAGPWNLGALVDAVTTIAVLAANSDFYSQNFNRKSLKAALEMGLGSEADERVIFKRAYQLSSSAIEKRMGIRMPAIQGDAPSSGPNYRQRWKALSIYKQ
jgi:hypothetical protein